MPAVPRSWRHISRLAPEPSTTKASPLQISPARRRNVLHTMHAVYFRWGQKPARTVLPSSHQSPLLQYPDRDRRLSCGQTPPCLRQSTHPSSKSPGRSSAPCIGPSRVQIRVMYRNPPPEYCSNAISPGIVPRYHVKKDVSHLQ